MEKKQSTIAGRLRSLREERNMMQKEVAQFLRITPQAYSHYELGKRTPDIRDIGEACRLLSCIIRVFNLRQGSPLTNGDRNIWISGRR